MDAASVNAHPIHDSLVRSDATELSLWTGSFRHAKLKSLLSRNHQPCTLYQSTPPACPTHPPECPRARVRSKDVISKLVLRPRTRSFELGRQCRCETVWDCCERTGKFRPLIENGAVLSSKGSTIIDSVQNIPFLTGVYADTRDIYDPCPPTVLRRASSSTTASTAPAPYGRSFAGTGMIHL